MVLLLAKVPRRESLGVVIQPRLVKFHEALWIGGAETPSIQGVHLLHR